MSSFKKVLEEAEKVKAKENLQEPEPEQPVYANITIRVLKKDRAHWQAEAKREGVTITELITKFLSERYGRSPLS